MKRNTKLSFIITIVCVIVILSVAYFLSAGITLTQNTNRTCTYCNNGENLNVNYFYKKELSTTATCTEGGISKIKCIYCDKTAEITVNALGHDYKCKNIDTTCQKDGKAYYACKRNGCLSTYDEDIKASSLYHKWIETYSKETMYYKYTDYKCSVCNETKSDKTKIDMGHQIKSTEEEFWYATSAAIQIVKEQLKYPSSARFIKESQMEVHYNWSSYFIEGAVSAPNAFGVYTDYYFIVKTKIKVLSTKYTWYDYDCVLEK